MSRRDGVARLLVLVWATFQLLAPGATAVAHGMSAIETSGAPSVHVEGAGSASCPEVHSPDCGVCRYLSLFGQRSPEQKFWLSPAGRATLVPQYADARGYAIAALPPGRAPPSPLT